MEAKGGGLGLRASQIRFFFYTSEQEGNMRASGFELLRILNLRYSARGRRCLWIRLPDNSYILVRQEYITDYLLTK